MNRIYFFFLLLVGLLAHTENSSAQVLINEVMSSNFSCIANESGHYEDWIELYNNGTSPVNLAGYGLSDNAGKLYKFTFPSYQLPANDHVLIFADDTNLTDIGTHWASAVKADDIWRYRANTTDPIDTNWRNLSFNETVWSSGPGGFGFGDGDDATTTPVCASIFIRKTFTITDTSKIMDAVFNIDYDDGFVAFLNGVEIARTNIEFPGSRPAWNTVVYATHEAVGYQGMPIDSFHFDQAFIRSIIRNGTNVLAIQAHNRAANESDMSCIPYLSFRIKDATVMFSPTPSWFASNLHPKKYFHASFKLSQSGETVYLTNPSGGIVDQIAVPALNLDNSYGRNTDAENLWKYFGTATPDTTNNMSAGYNGYATIPLFSLQGGFYSGTQTLTLSTTYAGGVIRYSTNGNAPTTTSPVYTAPLTISATSSVRARVFSPTSLPSQTITNTYFINLNCKLPVYSLTLDSADLWDYNKGIFVKGPNASPNTPYFGANYWQDWEKYASIEFFDKQKNRAFKFNAGLSITGGWSRRFDQKCLEIKLSDKYALSKLQYEIIPDKKWIDKWNDFLLHTTGNDRNICHMRDPVMERLMKGTNSDYTAYEPCLLYINGALWGVYHTKENDDQHFVEENYGYGKSEIDLLKESYFFPEIEVKVGSDTAFRAMHSYAKYNSPTSTSFYATMDSMIDIKNQVDYFAAECYYPNDDWMGGSNNNLKLWRPRKQGGRFRYILYDLDFGFGIAGTVSSDILAIAMNPTPHNYNSDIFQRLLLNPQYKNYFINRYADLINTIWQQSNVVNVVNTFRDSMRYDMHFQFERWSGDTNIWNNNIASMLTFSNGRPVYARNQIQTNMGMAGQVTLTLQASPAGAGRIQISTITPQTLPWSGVYFNGNPVTVTAIPNPGYTFNHWQSNVAITTIDTNRAVTRNYTANDVITAYFTGSPITPQIIVSEINYNSDSASNSGDWFELHNMTSSNLDISGWKVKDDNDQHELKFPVTTTIAANGYLVVAEDTAKFRLQHPSVTNVIGQTGFNLSDGGDQIRLFKYNDSLFLSLEYSDQAPWTTAADGEGYTLELRDSTGDFNDGNNWFAGCPGGSPGRAYTPTIAAFTASRAATICQGDTLILTANIASGNQYQWLRNNAAISGATGSLYQPSISGTYALSVTNNGCTALSDSVTVTINPVSANPVTSSTSRCGNGSVTLSATAVDPVSWFNSQNILVGTGQAFTTASLTQSSIYYAQAGSVCPSQLIPDTVTINAIPTTPVVTNKNVCGHGVMALKATSNGVIRWYDAPNGNLIATGDSLVTPDLTQTTNYYVQSGDICKSGFVMATATVNPVSAVPVSGSVSNCGAASITLQASATDNITWFDLQNNQVGTGSNFTTPMLSQTTIYFVRAGTTCPSALVADTVTINSVPSTPVVTGQSVCGHGVMSLSATSSAVIKWYDAPNGNLILTGNTFVTPDLNQTTTYYVQSGVICKSNFIPVIATVNTVSAGPVSGSISNCGAASITLQASASDNITWFDSQNNQVGTGSNFTTPVLSQTTIYFVRAGTTCPSALVADTVTINSIPSTPVVTGQSVCGHGMMTLNATSNAVINWYDAPNGSLVGTGNSMNTPDIYQTTTYYAQSGALCKSNFIPAVAKVIPVSVAPVSNSVSRCDEGVLILNANASDTIYWYDSPNGMLINTGVSFQTPTLSSTVTYYLRVGSVCPSNYISVQAIISPTTPDPVVPVQSHCGIGSVTLTASATDTVRWYDSPNGNLLFTGNTFVTPPLNLSTTYFVTSGTSCVSNAVAAEATINTISADPVVTESSRCGAGTLLLTAQANDQVKWYESPGGNLLYTGGNFTTPSITQTTTFYARAGDICPGSFVPVTAIVNAIPVDPIVEDQSRCGAGVVELSAAGADTIRWYSSQGGNKLAEGMLFSTGVIGQTTTYYVQANGICPGNFIPVQAIINAIPQDAMAANQSRCGSGSITLNAISNDTIRWYDAPNGNQLATGISYATPLLNASATYYVRAENVCAGNFIPVQATIINIPQDAVSGDQSRCGSGSITLNATSNDTIRWYDAPNGNLLATGTGYATPVLNSTTTYYVRAENVCAGNFTPVQAIINAIPQDVVAADQSFCGSGGITLNAISNDAIRWYDAPNGNLLATGPIYATPVLNSTTTYYVRAENVCAGNFIPVQAIIRAIPQDALAADQSRCGSGSITLNATSNDTIRWYDAPNGNLLATGTSYTTSGLNSSTTYYVRAENVCVGNFIPVQAIIHAIPEDAVTADQSRCGSGSFILIATSNDTILWYDAPNGNVLATGTSFATPVISQTTTYYVRSQSVCPGNYVAVQAIINGLPADPTVIPGSTCGPGTVVLIASSPDTINWFDAPNGTLLGTGMTYQTQPLNATTTFFAAASNGCHGSYIAVNANVFSIPQFSLGNDTIIESGTSVTLDAGSGFASYLWNTGETSQTAIANSTGNYWVTVTDLNGCSTTDTMQVLVTVNVQPYVISEGVLIYPNPTQSKLSISFINSSNEDLFLRLVNSDGKVIWSDFSVKEKRVMRTINLEQYAKGIYVLQLATPNEKREFKVILK
ncbi:MAG: CotH kinase family protein [Bacteroidetes bacterium]|nr:CotH kinase family protein [Bacteroidota bacterium]